MDSGICIENGTNELEILEFTLAGNSYGINVAKIKEIITYQPVTPVPNSHPSIEGIFMPRDTMIIEEVKKELTGHIIPFWNKLRDDENGGFYGFSGSNPCPCGAGSSRRLRRC